MGNVGCELLQKVSAMNPSAMQRGLIAPAATDVPRRCSPSPQASRSTPPAQPCLAAPATCRRTHTRAPRQPMKALQEQVKDAHRVARENARCCAGVGVFGADTAEHVGFKTRSAFGYVSIRSERHLKAKRYFSYGGGNEQLCISCMHMTNVERSLGLDEFSPRALTTTTLNGGNVNTAPCEWPRPAPAQSRRDEQNRAAFSKAGALVREGIQSEKTWQTGLKQKKRVVQMTGTRQLGQGGN
eukprot:5735096-Pleurochrysis_carterae.AAC.2